MTKFFFFHRNQRRSPNFPTPTTTTKKVHPDRLIARHNPSSNRNQPRQPSDQPQASNPHRRPITIQHRHIQARFLALTSFVSVVCKQRRQHQGRITRTRSVSGTLIFSAAEAKVDRLVANGNVVVSSNGGKCARGGSVQRYGKVGSEKSELM